MKSVENVLLFAPASEQYICRIVNKLKSKRSSGYDDISNVVTKDLINVIKVPLCMVFNKSLHNGEFPDLMKVARVIPLHKGGNKDVPGNYRPISLLPVFSKILEHIVYDHLVRHCTENNIIYSRQYGFRKDHSTSDAIANFVGDALQAMDQGSMILSVFIDLWKAFDTVPHSLILRKLEVLGVKGKELEWFISYMKNRRQSVVIKNVTSEPKYMSIGVPQGSLLGVLLFQLLINDLPNSLGFVSSILYADDTTLYLTGRSLHFLRVKMQHDLGNLSLWLTANGLKLNVGKTKTMLFTSEGLTPNMSLEIDGQVIDMVTHFKFLGILLDNKLSFENHYENLSKKLSSFHFIARKLHLILPEICLRTIYFAYFHANLIYGISLWYPLLKKSAQKALYVTQKRIVRVISGASPIQHCMPLFRKQSILTVSDVILIDNCKLMYYVNNFLCPPPVSYLFGKNGGTVGIILGLPLSE